MVKKITKYAKFVVCVALILSLIAPSYAALSASDGSAFVTKAEFDSALADFNARLTTFEAGINSKIDSQVTSYLDRNGIWNGARADLVTSPLNFGSGSWFYIDTNDNNTMKTLALANSQIIKLTDTTFHLQYKLGGSWNNQNAAALGGDYTWSKAWFRMQKDKMVAWSFPVAYKAPKSGMVVAVASIAGASSMYNEIYCVKNDTLSASGNNVFYYASDGFAWVKDNPTGGTLTTDMLSGWEHTVFIPPVLPSDKILSTFNMSKQIMNIQFRKDRAYQIKGPIRYQLDYADDGIVSYTPENLTGNVKEGGTYVSTFFVSKDDVFYVQRFKMLSWYDPTTVDYNAGLGNGLTWSYLDLKIY